jgi:hypothetical protein
VIAEDSAGRADACGCVRMRASFWVSLKQPSLTIFAADTTPATGLVTTPTRFCFTSVGVSGTQAMPNVDDVRAPEVACDCVTGCSASSGSSQL